ncbi:hypothetical protein [Amycolatopsis aidingensis]|uniref:hypothetical protein n=1 Tax=Amycolatopsis aidingensis TaxID=2842453 RepID=UPI001C0ABBC2|nr:hypothetical protein [Amycolatopsis aidingensis]
MRTAAVAIAGDADRAQRHQITAVHHLTQLPQVRERRAGRDLLAASAGPTGDPEQVIIIAEPRAADHGVRFSAGADRVALNEVTGAAGS